ncbi:MAG: hypothetical protein ABUS57_07355 [Pseudomonadota bacterium]
MDLSRLSALSIHAVSTMVELTSELQPTLDTHAPNYAQRMQGVERMRGAAAITLRGAAQVLGATREVREEGRFVVAQSVVDEWPRLAAFISPADRQAVQSSLHALSSSEPSERVRALLAQII